MIHMWCTTYTNTLHPPTHTFLEQSRKVYILKIDMAIIHAEV